jgi:predicted RNase H-like nuclease (RuvC/YqgF family)
MAYVRKKKVKRGEYYQLVESRRVDGRPRQKVLMHLGEYPTVDAALDGWRREIKKLRDRARKDSALYEDLAKKIGNERWIEETIGDLGERVDHARRKADALEAKLKNLRNLKKTGLA